MYMCSPEWLPGDGGKKKAVRTKKLNHSKNRHVLPKKRKRMEELGSAGDDIAMATTQSLSSKCMMAVEEEEEAAGEGGSIGHKERLDEVIRRLSGVLILYFFCVCVCVCVCV